MIRITNASFLGLPTSNRLSLARIVIWVGIAVQVGWMIGSGSGDATGPWNLSAVTIFILLAVTSAQSRVPILLARGFFAVAFLGSVADRFGAFGGPGTAGVSWGSFSAFIDYTRDVNAFLPQSFAPTLAVIATIAEIVLGLAIALGRWQQFAARIVTCMLIAYGLAMTVSLDWQSPFEYSVWLLAGGSWMLALPLSSTWRPSSPRLRWRHRGTISTAKPVPFPIASRVGNEFGD